MLSPDRRIILDSSLKDVDAVSVKDGTWKEPHFVYIKDSGNWKKVYVKDLENFVDNGYLDQHSNFNFLGATYIHDVVNPFGAPGVLERAGYNSNTHVGYRVKVDKDLTYKLSGVFRSTGALDSRLYYGLVCIDHTGASIAHYHNHHRPASHTTLTADLNDGDTVVHVASSAGWDNTTPGSYYHGKFFICWPSSWLHPAYTCADTSKSTWYKDIPSATTVELGVAWNKGTVLAGTPVANGYSGGSYQYIAAGGGLVPQTWTTYESTITGWGYNNGSSADVFRYGTEYVMVLYLMNYQQDVSFITQYGAIDFRRVAV